MGYTERPASFSHLKIPLSSVGSLHTLHPPTTASGLLVTLGFPAGSDGEESACNAGDMGWIWVGRPPGEGNGTPLQCSCLENSMDRGAWRATVHGAAKSRIQLSENAFTS